MADTINEINIDNKETNAEMSQTSPEQQFELDYPQMTTQVQQTATTKLEPNRLWSSFRQRRSGKNWLPSAGRIQTPRKRQRQFTESPVSLNGTEHNHDVPEEGSPQDTQLLETILYELQELREDVQDLTEENRLLSEKCIKLDSMSRRNNLKIWGICEQRTETKFDTRKKVMDLLHEYGINVSARDIGKVHRLGAKDFRNEKSMRCTLVQFLHPDDKELTVTRGRQMYSDYGVRLEDDFPPEIEDRRKDLRPVLQAANRCKDDRGERKYKAFLNADKLTINGKHYTTNNVEKLPEELKLKNVSTPQKDGITAFFSKNSPLSNHHPAMQKVEGIVYSSNEQYYMQQKSLCFGDTSTATRVMNEQDPKKQKGLCKKFDKLNQEAWHNKRLDIMKSGLKAKFEQNQYLTDFLLNTKTNNILECNRGDPFWGIGMGLNNPNIWKRNSWTGKAQNQLGRLLMELRTELKRPASNTEKA